METTSAQTTLQKDADQKSVQVLADAISVAINDNEGDKRFIDLKRIPLICLSITNIHSDVKEIKDDIKVMMQEFNEKYVTKDSFIPVRLAVYGMVGVLGTGIIGAILTMILKK